VAEGRYILTRQMKEDLLSQGFTIERRQEGPECPSPFPGRTEWIIACKPDHMDLPRYFACGYVPVPTEHYFEEEED